MSRPVALTDRVSAAAAAYAADGFVVTPVLIGADVLDAACVGVAAVIAGEYATGVEPYAKNWIPSERDGDVISMAEPHRCDPAIRAAALAPELGEWAAGLTGAQAIEVIAVDLFYKGPATAGRAHVGWHQDSPFLDGEDEVLTAWLALSRVTEESAPLMYVRGSHRAGRRTDRSNLFAPDIELSRVRALVPEATESDVVAVSVPRGAAAFHHRDTVHASGPNTASHPRISLAVRMRARADEEPGPTLVGHETVRVYPRSGEPGAGV